jgi:hypothetical protein
LKKSGFLDLPVFEVHERIAAKDADRDAEFAALGIDFFDKTVLVLERTIGDLHFVAHFKLDLGFYRILAVANLRKQAFDLFGAHGNRMVLGASEAQDAIGFLDEIPGLVDELVVLIEQVHVGDDVTREKLASCLGFFTTLDFLNAFGRNQDLVDMVTHFLGRDAAVDVFLNFGLLSGEHMNNIPLVFRGDGHWKKVIRGEIQGFVRNPTTLIRMKSKKAM